MSDTPRGHEVGGVQIYMGPEADNQSRHTWVYINTYTRRRSPSVCGKPTLGVYVRGRSGVTLARMLVYKIPPLREAVPSGREEAVDWTVTALEAAFTLVPPKVIDEREECALGASLRK